MEMEDKKVFISYSWDDEYHKKWVKSLSDELLKYGVDVFLDQYDLHLGKDITLFAGKISVADKVILILTPIYKIKAEQRNNTGVGYECSIITAEIFNNQATDKFLPIIRRGDCASSVPNFIKSKVNLDMRDESNFHDNLNTLLRVIYGIPQTLKPPKREQPNFSEIEDKIIVSILNEIGTLSNKLIETVEKVPLVEIDSDGVKIMVLEKSEYQNQINSFINNFEKYKNTLLLNLKLSVFEYRYIIINGILEQIRSYFAMERQGSNITEEKWKSLFKEELLYLFRGLCDNVSYAFMKE